MGKGIDLSENLLVWYRVIITSISLFIFAMVTRQSLKVPRQYLFSIITVGTILTVHWLFFYGAIKYSNVSITLSIFSSSSLFSALLEPIITGKKFDKRELIYSTMGMAGIGIIFYTGGSANYAGIFMGLLAALTSALFNILNKKIVTHVPSITVSFYEIFTGLVLLTLTMPFYVHYIHPSKILPSTSDWVLLFILALGCTHITMILSLNALRYLTAFTMNLSLNLEPVYGIALAFIIFGENKTLGPGFFIGTLLIMLSVILHSYFAGRKTVLDV